MFGRSKPPIGTPLNRSHHLNYALAACWPMWEMAGQRVQDIVGGADATFNALQIQSETQGWTGGHAGGGGIRFNGTSGRLDIVPSPALQRQPPISLAAWFQPLTVGESNTGIILTGNGSITLSLSSSSRISFAPLLTGNAPVGIIKFGLWNHIVVTYDLVTIRYYLNGLVLIPIASTEVPAAVVSMQMGNNTADARTFNGVIDDVRVWNRILSRDEALLLYTHPYCMFTPGIAGRKLFRSKGRLGA